MFNNHNNTTSFASVKSSVPSPRQKSSWAFGRKSSLAIWEMDGETGPVPLLPFRVSQPHLDFAPRLGRNLR
jgi:hypothetical protein